MPAPARSSPQLRTNRKSPSTSSMRQIVLVVTSFFLGGALFTSVFLINAHHSHQHDLSTMAGGGQRQPLPFLPGGAAGGVVRGGRGGGLVGSSSGGAGLADYRAAEGAAPVAPSSTSVLSGLRVLVALASFDFSQLPHLEEVLDGYHDLSVSGVERVDVYIHSTVPYPVQLIDLLNSRLSGSGGDEGKMTVTIVLKSPSVRLNLVDYHRTLFYEKIDEYDLFVYSEDDIRVSPRTVTAYMTETNRVRSLVGPTDASNYNVGIVRYEYNYPEDVVITDKTRHATENVTRVYWEHLAKPPVPDAANIVDDPKLGSRYVSMFNHHQGMFFATRDLLKAWKVRTNCNFDVIRQRPGAKNKPSQPTEGTQRVWMSSQMLHGGRHCNVKQLLPLETFGQLTVLHLPNKNYRRVGKKGRIGGQKEGAQENQFSDGTEVFNKPDPSLLTAMQLHVALRKNFPSPPHDGGYNGIRMVDDEIDWRGFFRGKPEHQELVSKRMQEYKEYVARGGVMSESDMAVVWRE